MDKKLKDKIDKRQIHNRRIVEEISAVIEKYPDLRFHQILAIMGINKNKVVNDESVVIDRFHEESADTLNNLMSNKDTWDK